MKPKILTMLWADYDAKKSVEVILQEAAVYYEKKYGVRPDYCLMNQERFSALAGPAEEIELAGIRVVGKPYVRPLNYHISAGGNHAGA
jgi:hypothetical protein